MHHERLVLLRGGGDLGTGIAHALFTAGWQVVVRDQPQPTALRLSVAFAAAALEGRITVEGVEAVHCRTPAAVGEALRAGRVPLWTDAEDRLALQPAVVVDARMRSLSQPCPPSDGSVLIGIGPGFTAGRDAEYVIESNRGPELGRVITRGRAQEHTGVPGAVAGFRLERLLRAPRAGSFQRRAALGDFVEVGQVVGEVDGAPVRAQLRGMIRGLKLSGVSVGTHHKVGDVDPRRDRSLLNEMTDKARAVGRGVLEALALAEQRRAG